MVVLIRFVITGGAAALIFAATAFALRSWFEAPPFLASGTAFLAGFVFAYPLQRQWTFGGRHGHRKALPRYFAAQIICLALSALISQALVVVGGAQPAVMAVGTVGAVGLVSLILTRFWVFA